MDDLPPRFWSKVTEMPGPLDTPCWVWTAGISGHGYGGFKINRVMVNAHILTWQLFMGERPEGLVFDHLCRVRACCNPWHLDPVTHEVNILRGVSYCAEQARKTRCNNGHEFTPENTSARMDTKRGRRCKQCQRDATRRYRAKRRVAV